MFLVQGGFEFKKSIVDTILVLIGEIPDAVESGLAHLCEFIEDCEFTFLRFAFSASCVLLFVNFSAVDARCLLAWVVHSCVRKFA